MIIVGGVVSAGVIIILSAVFFIPTYFVSLLVPGIAHEFGIENFQCDFRRISLSGSDVGRILIMSSDSTGISAPAVQVDYSWLSLMRKQIKRVRLAGVSVNLNISDRKLQISGIDLDRLFRRIKGGQKHKTDHGSSAGSSGFSVETIEIHNAMINIHQEEFQASLPFSLELFYHAQQSLTINLYLPVMDTPLQFQANTRPDTQELTAEFKLNTLNLKHITKITDLIPDLELGGVMSLEGNFSASLEPLAVTGLTLTAEYTNGVIQYKGFRLAAYKLPLKLIVQQQNQTIKTQLSNMFIESPVSVQLCDVNTEIIILNNRYSASINAAGPDPALSFHAQTIPVLSGLVESIIDLHPDGKTEYHVKGKDLSLTSAEFICRFNNFSLTAAAENDKYTYSGQFNQTAVNTGDEFKVSLPRLSVKGTAARDSLGQYKTEAGLDITGASFSHLPSQLSLTGITGKIPLKLPAGDSTTWGRLTAENFHWQGKAMGEVNARVGLSHNGIEFSAANKNRLLPGATLELSGYSHFFLPEPAQTSLTYQLNLKHSDKPLDLGLLHQESAGIQLNGDIHIKGNVRLSENINEYSLQSSLNNGMIALGDNSVNISEITAKFDIPDLIQGRSLPAQTLSFKKAAMGNIEINDGRLAFQLEPGGVLFIETSLFFWCNGKVHGKSFRIKPYQQDYDLLFHGDGLNFAELLKQLNIGEAQGQGTVNGSLPIRLTEGKIIIDNGFFYSTPGVGGSISLSSSSSLSKGIPAASQLGQIDLVIEALKEYSYNWVKLNMNTQADTEALLLRLQFDGKPTRPLPFIYNADKGGFVRTHKEKASVFQGISLDVNFKLPLNELLKYKQLFRHP